MPKKSTTPSEPSGLPHAYRVKDAATAKQLATDLRTIGYQASADGDVVHTDAGRYVVAAMVAPSSIREVVS